MFFRSFCTSIFLTRFFRRFGSNFFVKILKCWFILFQKWVKITTFGNLWRIKQNCVVFDTVFFRSLLNRYTFTLKYSISGWLMYRPLTDACGYMAPFSVRLMPTLPKSMSFAMLKISLMFGSTG